MNTNKGLFALLGAGLGVGAYFYLAHTQHGQEVVNKAKDRLDDYLANLQDRVESAINVAEKDKYGKALSEG